MAWYCIVAIILGYIAIGALGAAITRRYERSVSDIEVLVAVFWPGVLIAGAAIGVVYCVLIVPIKFITDKTCDLVNYICDKWDDWILKIQSRKAERALRSKSENDEEPSSVFDDIDYERRSK